MSVLRTLVSSSRALITGAKEVARFREIAGVFIRHGFGWVFAQLKLRRELQPDIEGVDLARAHLASPDTGKRLVAALTELGPTFVKLGQIFSTRTDLLPESIIAELTTLQSNVGPLPFAEIEPQLVKTLGKDWRSRFASFDEILDRTIEHNPTRSESSLRRGVLHNAKENPDGTWSWRYDAVRDWAAAGGAYGTDGAAEIGRAHV